MADLAIEPTAARAGIFESRRGRHIKEALQAYLFLFPSLFILIIFSLFPVLYAFYVSLHRWPIVKREYRGLQNYLDLLGKPLDIVMFAAGLGLLVLAWFVWKSAHAARSDRGLLFRLVAASFLIAAGWLLLTTFPQMYKHGDPKLFKSLVVTVFYAIGTVPIQLALSLVLAVVLFQKIHGKSLFRVLYFLPYITPSVASAAVWTTIFEPRRGLINSSLIGLGMPEDSLPRWLFESDGVVQSLVSALGIDATLPWLLAGPSLALIAVIIYNVWVFTGYNTTIFLAGLGNISKEMYEAAEIDGAGRWAAFRHITLPLLSPTTFFLSMMGVIGTFQAFNHIFVMTKVVGLGEPQFTTATNSIYIWQQFREASKYGYASAMAFILFGIILTLTQMQNKIAKEKVHYGQ